MKSTSLRIHSFIFDLLVCKGRDLTGLPLMERRKQLSVYVKPKSSDETCAFFWANGERPLKKRGVPETQQHFVSIRSAGRHSYVSRGPVPAP